MTVISLAKYRDRETNELLRNLAIMSEEEGGSVLVVYRDPQGWERVGLTGIYKADPTKALMAAMQLSIALTKEEEFVRGRP